jgi:hypothetical protein
VKCEALCSLPVHTEFFKPLSALACSVKLQRADGIMAPSVFARKILLLESANLKLKRLTKKRKWVHEFNEERNRLGHFHHLYRDARLHTDKIHDYLRMTTNTSDTLLEKVEVHLCGPGTNYREMISAEQRLVLTSR